MANIDVSPHLSNELGRDEIRWYPNTYRAACVHRDQVQLRAAFGLAAATAGLLLVFVLLTRSPNPPTVAILSSLALMTVFGMLSLGLVAQFSPKTADDRHWYSPTRVGFSRQGIHVEFDPSSAPRRIHSECASTFLAWETIEGKAPPVILSDKPHTVRFDSGASYPTEIWSISTELVNQILREYDLRRPSADPV